MNINQIITMYTKQHKSTYEIAEKFNTYPNRIRRILIKNGVCLKTKSEAQKNAIENGTAIHPTSGKTRTKEEKLSISSGLKKYWDDMSDEIYKSRVDQSRKRWNSLSDVEKDKMMSAAIKSIQIAGKEGSKLEKFLYQEISKAGYVVQYHKKHLIQNHDMELDMYIPELKTIIEVDGPSHFLPIWGEDKLQKQIKADTQKSGLLLSKGMVIIRIKNLSDSVCLADKEKLRLDLLKSLSTIKDSFPKKSERYIEIEI